MVKIVNFTRLAILTFHSNYVIAPSEFLPKGIGESQTLLFYAHQVVVLVLSLGIEEVEEYAD